MADTFLDKISRSAKNGIITKWQNGQIGEIVDLQNFLNASGARIKGAGTSVIEIEGVKKLHGVTYLPIPDRIVAGTVMCAVAACCTPARTCSRP